MSTVETPRNHAGEVTPPTVEEVVLAPEVVETAPAEPIAPKVEIPPPKSRKPLIIALCAVAFAGACGIGYWKRATLPALIDLVPPYSSAIAFVLLGIIGAFYKDKYRHTAAKWTAVTIMVVFGFLMGVNTYKDRAARAQEKADRANEKTKNEKTSEGIIGSVDHIRDELKDFKDKVKPDEIQSEMSGLRATMEKVINPPKAELLFSFAPLDRQTLIPIRDVTLPVNPDGSVQVRFAMINNTDVPANGLKIEIEICIPCKFAKEPAGFVRLEGSADQVRDYTFGDMSARGVSKEFVVDIITPAYAQSFDIRVSHRCITCVLQRIGTVGEVHIKRN